MDPRGNSGSRVCADAEWTRGQLSALRAAETPPLGCPVLAFHGQENYPGREMALPDRRQPAERAFLQLSSALELAGWKLTKEKDGGLGLVRHRDRLALEYRYSREPRQAVLKGLLADAILSGRAHAGSRKFLAVVAAPGISPAMGSVLEEYAAGVAQDEFFGYADDRGLVRVHGRGLDEVRADAPARPRGAGRSAGHPRDLFSDLNQWMLKVLLGRSLGPELISVPRDGIASASELSARARVSGPGAWRLVSALRAEGHVDEAGRPVRVRDLLARWRAAALRPQRELGAVWIMPGRKPLERLRRALADTSQEPGPASACLGLFAACDAMGVGHVRGAPVHLYVRSAGVELLEKLGLAPAQRGEPSDVTVRVARWPESVFRAAAHPNAVPVADVLQCWLDVSAHPARGAEQADYLWKRVLGPALVPGEPQP